MEAAAKYYISNGEVLLFKNSYKIKPQGVCYVFNSCREGIEVHIPCILGELKLQNSIK